ncbi:MAG: type II secretion system F family protein [Candidatus Omnitrophica bacterium]|nr:type II secretion system F family protein [Candidatus Omnitrophota bacterium]
MLYIVLGIVFATAGILGYYVIPALYGQMMIMGERRKQDLSSQMEQLMPKQQARKMSRMFVFFPISFAAAGFILFPEQLRFLGVILGIIGGFLFPGIYINMRTTRTRDKFNDQLVDALMIMSSSFRGGLSLVQAVEAVVEEMPNPINREFGTVLGENKMGVALEEALNHLYERMPSAALQQMITAILLARETGGNLPAIFSRISTTIRENKKIQQNLDTLTLQGKIQGFVMALLPIGFAFIIMSSNPKIMQHMFVSKVGQMMLVYAVISEIIGAILVIKISTFKDF